MKKNSIWVVKMINKFDEAEFDRWIFGNLKEAYSFLEEYLPGTGLLEDNVHEFLDDLIADAHTYQYAKREWDEGGIEIFSVCTSKPNANDYIV